MAVPMLTRREVSRSMPPTSFLRLANCDRLTESTTLDTMACDARAALVAELACSDMRVWPSMEVISVEETYDACISLGRQCGFEEEHCRQDARLAVWLFDLTADLHQLGDESRDLLFCAGLLHDIGYVEGYWGHHKTAYRLIMEADFPGLTKREKQIVANVARYHRGAKPKLSHKGFAALDPDDRDIVTMLGALLRLADGLDRGHISAVEDLDAQLDGDRLTILVDCPLGCGTEVWAGEKKGRFLGRVLDVRVQVRERLQT